MLFSDKREDMDLKEEFEDLNIKNKMLIKYNIKKIQKHVKIFHFL